MLHLLTIEYSKVKNYTTFWVILAIYAIIIPLAIWGISSFSIGQESSLLFWKGSSIFEFPVVWNGVTYVASWLNLLLGILIILNVCNDFNYRTFKQNVIDGLSKKQVITSKFLFLIVLAIAVTLYTFILSILFGLIFSDGGTVFKHIYFIGIYFIQTIGYFTLALLFSILLRRTALSIIVFILTVIIVTPIMTGMLSLFLTDSSIVQLFPINVISDLTPFPLQSKLDFIDAANDAQAKSQVTKEVSLTLSQGVRTIVAIGYISIFVFISNLILKKRDL